VSLKDLQDAGVLLPEDEWGVHELHTSVNKPQLIAALALGLFSVILMYIGGGRALTFIGSGLFLIFMGWITYISVHAVKVQSAQFDRERHDAHMHEGEPLPGEEASGEG